jgi:hypothetical protein
MNVYNSYMPADKDSSAALSWKARKQEKYKTESDLADRLKVSQNASENKSATIFISRLRECYREFEREPRNA